MQQVHSTCYLAGNIMLNSMKGNSVAVVSKEGGGRYSQIMHANCLVKEFLEETQKKEGDDNGQQNAQRTIG